MTPESPPRAKRNASTRGLVLAVLAVVALGLLLFAFLSAGTPSGLSVAELVDEEQEIGSEATVRGVVDAVYEERYLTLVDRGFLGLFESEPVLVVLDDGVGPVDEGDRITATGVLERAVELGVPPAVLDDLEDELFHAAEIRPALLALTIRVDE